MVLCALGLDSTRKLQNSHSLGEMSRAINSPTSPTSIGSALFMLNSCVRRLSLGFGYCWRLFPPNMLSSEHRLNAEAAAIEASCTMQLLLLPVLDYSHFAEINSLDKTTIAVVL